MMEFRLILRLAEDLLKAAIKDVKRNEIGDRAFGMLVELVQVANASVDLKEIADFCAQATGSMQLKYYGAES
jgi:hypothetical protein